jgi:hypothetical protein
MTVKQTGAAIDAWRQDGEIITQEQVGLAAGATSKTGHRWCRGMAEPTLAQVRRLERLRPGLVRRLFPGTEPA